MYNINLISGISYKNIIFGRSEDLYFYKFKIRSNFYNTFFCWLLKNKFKICMFFTFIHDNNRMKILLA